MNRRLAVLTLLAELGNPERRCESARSLACHLGVDDLVVFVNDAGVGTLLPAPGFPQTLPGGRAWRAFLQACAGGGECVAEVPALADPGTTTTARGVAADDGSALLVLLGGTPRFALLDDVRPVLPLLGAAIRGEQATRAAAVQEALARESASRARALAGALEGARAELQRALSAAEGALQARDEFLSVAAHELKTPITSLRGVAQLALRLLERHGSLEPDRTISTLQSVELQSHKLARLVNQLLDVSRIDGGRLSLDPERVDLAALVREVAAAAQAMADSHRITVDAPARLEAVVDPLRIEQVLRNLVDNAVKYSPSGGRVAVGLGSSDDSTVRLEVRDFGLGIAPEHRGHVFDRFYQAHGQTSGGGYSGMGLGLHISRQIVELHGGTIVAEFPEDGGTRFVVELRAGGGPPGAPAGRPGAPGGGSRLASQVEPTS